MGDLHVLIVNNVGKVIGGKAIPLHDDKVLLRDGLLEAMVDNVVEGDGLLGALEPHGEGVSSSGALLRFLV